MSDCGVCLAGEGAGSDTAFIRLKIRRARKSYVCSECSGAIAKGSRYEYASGMTDGGMWSYRTCLPCAEIAEAFYCNGRWFGGTLWDSMDEVFGNLTSGCLSRLKTAEAKAFLVKRWNDWKFRHL